MTDLTMPGPLKTVTAGMQFLIPVTRSPAPRRGSQEQYDLIPQLPLDWTTEKFLSLDEPPTAVFAGSDSICPRHIG